MLQHSPLITQLFEFTMVANVLTPPGAGGSILSELAGRSRHSCLPDEVPSPLKDGAPLLRLTDVLKRIPVSRSTWYLWGNPKSPYYDPALPKPVRLSKTPNGAVAWLESDIEAWIKNKRAQAGI